MKPTEKDKQIAKEYLDLELKSEFYYETEPEYLAKYVLWLEQKGVIKFTENRHD